MVCTLNRISYVDQTLQKHFHSSRKPGNYPCYMHSRLLAIAFTRDFFFIHFLFCRLRMKDFFLSQTRNFNQKSYLSFVAFDKKIVELNVMWFGDNHKKNMYFVYICMHELFRPNTIKSDCVWMQSIVGSNYGQLIYWLVNLTHEMILCISM